MRIKISNNTPPMAAIAIITIVLIFFHELFLVLLGAGGDTGEGEGAVPEHGSKGYPHRKAFPKKELAGNFCKVGGIGPLRLLLLKFKCLNLGSWRSGMGPESELFWRSNAVS
jgi:hypothetical protein